MANRWIESCDGDIGNGKYDLYSFVTTPAGRNGLGFGMNGGELAKEFDAQPTWIMGQAIKAGVSATHSIIALVSGGAAGTAQCGLVWHSDGSGRITFSGGGGYNVSSSIVDKMTLGAWYYLEMKVTVHTTAGSVEVRIDGKTVISASGVNTAAAGGTTADACAWLGHLGDFDIFDDLYVHDGTGSDDNDFWGDIVVQCLRPNGAGAHSDWTANGGSANYDRENETTPDGDTTYVHSSNAGDIDTYAFEDLAGSPVILGVQHNLIARREDGSTHSIKTVARPGSTDHLGDEKTLSTSYLAYSQNYGFNPDTSARYTAPQINAAEFGHKLIS